MRMHSQRRVIAGASLLAFLFAIAFPALAVARQAVDPLAYAKICRIDVAVANPGAPDTPDAPSSIKSAHCLMCLGTVSPPPVVLVAPIIVAAVAELILSVDRRPFVTRDPAALQPLNPRAPPRV